MSKYLEYFDGAFDPTVAEKIKPENKPYVAYSRTEGVVYSIVPKEDMFEVTYLKYVTTNDLKSTQYQVVDLGLPSGTKWLDRNIGAKTVDDYGAYFTWGNTDGVIFDTVLMTLDRVTELLVGPNYTEENKTQVKSDIDNGLLNYTHELADYPFGNYDAYNKTFGSKLEVVYNDDNTCTVIDYNDGKKVLAQNISWEDLTQLRIPLTYDIMNRINNSYMMPTREQYMELVNETDVMNILHDDNGNEYVVTLFDNTENGDDETDGYKSSYIVNPELPEGVDIWSLKLDRIIFTNKSDSSKSISFKANGNCYNFSPSAAIGIPGGNVYKPSTGSMLYNLDSSGNCWSSSLDGNSSAHLLDFYQDSVNGSSRSTRHNGYGVRGIEFIS